ncbi:MAG: hypothetical protein HY788_22730 [Deltaproteobacteria bacterium]|nr:hypothetical protein [Deltaproteobacteria bacterium]
MNDWPPICRAVKRAEEDEELIAGGGAIQELLQSEISQRSNNVRLSHR